MFSLHGKTALITGAGNGIGQAICMRLAEAGCAVAVTDKIDVSLERTLDVCRGYGVQVIGATLDVRDLQQIKSSIAHVQEQFGRLDILVNNAGINRPTKALEVDQFNWDDHFNIMVKGAFFCAQAVVPRMMENHFGRIIFISSQSGLIGIPGQSVYCAAKGAQVNMVRALGVEWATSNITVNSIAPTFIETNLTRERLKKEDFRKFVLGKIPKGELSVPDDVAYATVYLASEEAAMVNCATLSVDGGWTAW